ncbi:MAG: TM0106 family RecB-like putative nuclease [Candidatus Eremiobacteraeota bacterium]|nr:TM0106 family RecB-like putative nuclease [Candidatus Eremiobacteraeota bacterium]
MQLLDGRLIYSATDLNNFLECEHLIELERLVALGARERPAKSAQAELIASKGIEHEARHLQRLQTQFDDVVTIEVPGENTPENLKSAADATARAMQAGARIIYQGVFFDGTWLGKSDFLLRVETPSAKWAWSYEVADTKLALHTKPYFIIQLCFYSEQLAAIQGTLPAQMHVILGDGREENHRVEHYRAYYRRLRQRFESSTKRETYPLKVQHCDVCAWDPVCKQRREDDDHLSLVARIRRDQIKKLQGAEISTLGELATATPQQRPPAMAEPTFLTLHRQARLQQQQREAFAPNSSGTVQKYFYELLDPKEEQLGFALLPKPARGDIFFDMEGDPLFMPGRGLEYLFGVYAPDEALPFRSFWGHTPVEEKRAFEAFIDYLTERRKQFPEMHVYHYAPYEKTALRKLMGLHSTRENEVDDLLRGEVFVDLYAVVRQGIVISQPSYSIKKLEAFYEMKRETETKFGGDSIVMYETWVQDRSRQDILDDIERYNQDDCRSTWMLREWLLELRAEAVARHGEMAWYSKADSELCHAEPVEACSRCQRRKKEAAKLSDRQELRDSLLHGLEDFDAFTIEQQPDGERLRWMLAHVMEYHRREQKPLWWAFYDRCENRDDLIHGDNEAVGGLRLCNDVEPFKLKSTEKNLVYTYAFPDQQYKLKLGTVFDPATRKSAGELIAIDPETNRLQLKRSAAVHGAGPLKALIPGRPIATDAQEASLERIAQRYLAQQPSQSELVEDLLLRKPPRLKDHQPGERIQPEHVSAQTLSELVCALDGSYLFIQGPPGSGKSTKAASVITELLRSGKRVGVLSNSHAAIHNLLHKVEETAQALAMRFRGLQKCSSGEDSEFVSRLPVAMIESTDDNGAFGAQDWQLAAGTSWLFAREELAEVLDYLFIDEAGQIALADTVAVAPSARNIVLLGDPLQLAQVSQGTHPDGIGCSALEHLLGDDATIAPERGVFLDESYRMHPTLCEFISENVYEGRLRSAPQTNQQVVESGAGLRGAGLRFIPVDHRENAQESTEEAVRLAAEIETLLLASWTDAQGKTGPLTADDILVVTPYNAQRRRIQREFKKRNITVRVGTVDKFQGQEAAVVFFSMATSSSEELPRNIEFLFSRNRFNVAISRARCLAVLVCSPRLLDLRCSTIEQMALTNLLCSFVATASQPEAPAAPTDQLALF